MSKYNKTTKADLIRIIEIYEKTIDSLKEKYEASELRLYATELREEAERDKNRQILIDYIDELPNNKEVIEGLKIDIEHMRQFNHNEEVNNLRKENEILKNKIIGLI